MIKVTLTGATELKVKLDGYAQYFSDLTPLVLGILTLARQYVQRQFQTRGSQTGGWQPLRPETVRRKEKLGGTDAPLIGAGPFAGQLRDNWQLLPGARGGSMLSQVAYAKYHEFGLGHNPLRQMVPAGPVLEQIAQRVALDFIQRRLSQQ